MGSSDDSVMLLGSTPTPLSHPHHHHIILSNYSHTIPLNLHHYPHHHRYIHPYTHTSTISPTRVRPHYQPPVHARSSPGTCRTSLHLNTRILLLTLAPTFTYTTPIPPPTPLPRRLYQQHPYTYITPCITTPAPHYHPYTRCTV